MNAEIITIGDEILIGQIVDTNSAFVSEQLTLNGIEVVQISSVHDDREHIISAIQEAERRADLIILTGGLGPTKDDITKQTLSDYFQSDYVFNEQVFENIEKLFIPRGIPVLASNRLQAEVPHNCKILNNELGTAPGMLFENNDKIYISLPGVPYEMKALLVKQVVPYLIEKQKLPNIVHRTVLTQGMGESSLAEKIKHWHSSLDDCGIKLAFLPSPGIVRLRLTSIGGDGAYTAIEQKIEELKTLIPSLIFGYDKQTLEEVVGIELKKRHQTLATAESCTGGMIAGLITRIPGSSDYFQGAVVAYDNKVKVELLDVNSSDIDQYGAVSREVVEQMALGVKNKLNVDFAVATSGIAGPAGGTPDKPVGMVWIAAATPGKVVSEMYLFGDSRERNIRRTAVTALNILRKQIISQ